MGVGVAVVLIVGVGVAVTPIVGEGVAAVAADTVMMLELVGIAAMSSPLAFEVTTVLAGSKESVYGVETLTEPAVKVNDSRGMGVELMKPS